MPPHPDQPSLPPSAPNDAHGIYLRDGVDVRSRVIERAVSVRTQFANQDAAGQSGSQGPLVAGREVVGPLGGGKWCDEMAEC